MRFVLVALLLVLAGCSTGTDAVEDGTEFQFVSPGGKAELTYDGDDRQPVPPMSGEDLMSEGEQIAVSDFEDEVVVLNLWGAWCPPCRVEAPELEKVYEEKKSAGVVVLGINVRDYDRTAPQDFVRDTGLTYPSIWDPPGRSLLNLKGYPRSVVPSTIVLDKRHRVAAVFLRDVLAEDLVPVIDRLLAEK
ncbi:MAG: redoxin domain-containing protein [Actinophytocola sp.]|uniref:TlpA family protein disulfide reductase n=1 Tax=Actinophytocola sp. TaxID=1872138 RepID=UPI0013206CC5|nr:TlpA disulfide reductase family protein [Actinophytocola sp.]MPZ84145.1 redoxin domain-containing protein [Actinophytocola sp.]